MITFKELGRTGRLGNLLFQVAGCMGIARRSGQPFAFPKLVCHDMVERFGSKEDPEVWKYFKNELPHISVEEIEQMNYQRYPYFWDYRDIVLPTGNWDMYGHFQSIKFFEHVIDEVRHYFTFKDEYPQNDYVAIHYRAGDYIDDPNAYHPRCSMEYYLEAAWMFPVGTKFMIFSDDIEYAHEKFAGAGWKHGLDMIKDCSYIDDFRFMKSCKSFICANSSFSHMAALLGTHPEKKIIMPKKWFGTQAGDLNFDSLYPPNAVVI